MMNAGLRGQFIIHNSAFCIPHAQQPAEPAAWHSTSVALDLTGVRFRATGPDISSPLNQTPCPPEQVGIFIIIAKDNVPLDSYVLGM
jgi:hypothetical protein